jgi:hypothetical protein
MKEDRFDERIASSLCSMEALFNLTLWDQLSRQECEVLARAVARHLPSSFQFTHVTSYQVGTQQHRIAHFTWYSEEEERLSLFSLVPGETATLGYDREHPPLVAKDLVVDWQQFCVNCNVEAPGLDKDLVKREPYLAQYDPFYDYLSGILHPLRTVTIPPMLVEAELEKAEEVMPRPAFTYHRFIHETHQTEEKRFRRGGSSIPQHHVAAFLKQQGFRLLTSDEWEYVCAAGSHMFFYWVDEAFDWVSEAETWEDLRNAFGLSIANTACLNENGHRWEYCSDPAMVKGSDGGEYIGYFISAFYMTPASFYALDEKQRVQGVYGACFRRVYDLSQIVHEFRQRSLSNGVLEGD